MIIKKNSYTLEQIDFPIYTKYILEGEWSKIDNDEKNNIFKQLTKEIEFLRDSKIAVGNEPDAYKYRDIERNLFSFLCKHNQKRIFQAPDPILTDEPVIFLAGPVSATKNWQKIASEFIINNSQKICILNPRNGVLHSEELENNFSNRVLWESRGLLRASMHGMIIFWLAKQSKSHSEGAYAQTTRFELGEWLCKSENIAIGIEDGFAGASYIEERIKNDYPKMKIHKNLEETCFFAINKLNFRYQF